MKGMLEVREPKTFQAKLLDGASKIMLNLRITTESEMAMTL